MVFKLIFLFLCIKNVLSEGSILDPCNKDDVACLKKTTRQFLESTKQGIPQFNIKPVDPMFISMLDIPDYKHLGLVWRYENLNITGLKDIDVEEFNVDSEKKAVKVVANGNLKIKGDATVEFTENSKKYSGTVEIAAPVRWTISYDYGLKTKEGVEHFVVHEETIVCEALALPERTMSKELVAAVASDEYNKIKEKIQDQEEKIRKEVFCKIAEMAYHTVVHNIRSSAEYLPKTAFFKDL